ncbi:hypothetical protein BJV78DRAFT_918573 [Lactifluus subvellereus]|nr:hypothetical protein BJV78DRAFT_918573 [Lactifluus subvellereus]
MIITVHAAWQWCVSLATGLLGGELHIGIGKEEQGGHRSHDEEVTGQVVLIADPVRRVTLAEPFSTSPWGATPLSNVPTRAEQSLTRSTVSKSDFDGGCQTCSHTIKLRTDGMEQFTRPRLRDPE